MDRSQKFGQRLIDRIVLCTLAALGAGAGFVLTIHAADSNLPAPANRKVDFVSACVTIIGQGSTLQTDLT